MYVKDSFYYYKYRDTGTIIYGECDCPPSVQQQLETLTRQLEQQQKMMQQQQSLIEKMQRQLDEQKIAEEKMHQKGLEEEQKVHANGQELEQKTAKAEGDAKQALKEVDVLAKATGVDLSKEMFRYNAKVTTIKAPVVDTQLTIGGFIRVSFIHDFNAIESPVNFVSKDIVVNGQPSGAPNKRTTFTANASRLFFSSATPLKIGQFTTFFSFDLEGDSKSNDANVHLRQAWGQLDDFIFGGNLRVG